MLLPVWFLLVLGASAESDDFFALDMDYILNEKLMPLSMFMVDNDTALSETMMGRETAVGGDLDVETEDGTIGTALSTMGFHRRMMNEYLCSSYVAEEILMDMVPPQGFQRRTLNVSAVPFPAAVAKKDSKELMRFDEGSTGYKDWLSKMTSFNDIFRHVSPNLTVGGAPGGSQVRREFSSMDYGDEFEEGVFTGYAQLNPMAGYPREQSSKYQPTADSKTAHYPPTGGYQSGGYESSPIHYETHAHHVYEKPSKALGLKDLFDIALTTLAFLSFGLFILQILMCITMTRPPMAAGMVMMTNGGGNGGGNGGEEVDMVGKRTKRAVLDYENDLNDIARRVLNSMDAALIADSDDGKCLQQLICENNKFARERKDSQKIWLPVWGLGLSWLSSRVIPTERVSMPIFQSLRAGFIGLGGGECVKMYPCRVKFREREPETRKTAGRRRKKQPQRARERRNGANQATHGLDFEV